MIVWQYERKLREPHLCFNPQMFTVNKVLLKARRDLLTSFFMTQLVIVHYLILFNLTAVSFISHAVCEATTLIECRY